MNIFITGVAGFIGSNLAIRLLKDGHTVSGIDNLSYGFKRNISAIADHPNFEFIEGDLNKPQNFKHIKADVIVHLASQKIPRYDNALKTLEENQMMLRNVVKKCVADKSKIVYASTSDVYGKNPNQPFDENSDLVLGPTTVKRWSYALSKIYGEQYIIGNHDEHGIPYTIARFFGSYGPHQNLTWWGGPQSVFINKAFDNEEIELHGDGTQTRTFTYIDDTIEALSKCVLMKEANNEIFNIGSNPEEEISIHDLAVKIWGMIRNDKAKLTLIPYETFGRYEDVMRRVPNLTKIYEKLGYKSNTSLTEGLQKTIDWQKQIRETL
jgi:UDP-glucose 4-epimerase